MKKEKMLESPLSPEEKARIEDIYEREKFVNGMHKNYMSALHGFRKADQAEGIYHDTNFRGRKT